MDGGEAARLHGSPPWLMSLAINLPAAIGSWLFGTQHPLAALF